MGLGDDMSQSSMMQSKSHVGGPAGGSEMDDDESLSEAASSKRSGKKSTQTARKAAIKVQFKDDARPPVSIIVSSAATGLVELRRVLRKRMGRKFEVQNMGTPTGLTSGLSIELDPSMEGLDLNNFSVLDGISDPVLVTDNVGLVVFANDRAWETLGLVEDPGDTYILNYLKLAQVSKMDYVSELRNNRTQATLVSDKDSSFGVSVNQVTLGKCKLHVWTLISSDKD